MDTTDIAIVQALREDSRLSMRKLAAVVHMSAPAVAERVRRLGEEGIKRIVQWLFVFITLLFA